MHSNAPIPRLSINLNKVALLRNARMNGQPSLLEMAQICMDLGAQGLTLHPRPDLRHATPEDCHQISRFLGNWRQEMVKNQTQAKETIAELNIEGNPLSPANHGKESHREYPGLMEIVKSAQPAQCTLVPDDPQQLTSDSGWNWSQLSANDQMALSKHVTDLKHWQVRVALFVDLNSNEANLKSIAALGADAIEIYTGPWAQAWIDSSQEQRQQLLADPSAAVADPRNPLECSFHGCYITAQIAHELGMAVHAGHDLDRHNLPALLSLPGLKEVSIGHAITCEALKEGLPHVIEHYAAILRQSP